MNNLFALNTANKQTILFGVNHSFDPKNPQFSEIKKLWLEFLGVAKNTPKIAIVESYPSSESFDNEDHAIKKGGEVGFVTLLASRKNINVVCPEPDRKSQFEYLTQNFLKEDIAHYFFARPAGQWYRLQDPKPSLKDYLDRFIQRDKNIAGWSNFDYSYEHLSKLHEKLTGKSVGDTGPTEWVSLINPTLDSSPTNLVGKSLHDYRNRMVIENIKKYLETGNNLFIVYGSGHVDSLRKGLEA